MHFNDVLQLAARAWHEIKDPADPEFNQCAITHRENLGAAAKAVVDHEAAFSRFDHAVLRLYQEHKERQSKVEQLVDAHPTAHSDEIMHMAAGVPHPISDRGALIPPLSPQQIAAGNAQFGHAENVALANVREEFVPTVFEPVGQVEPIASEPENTEQKSAPLQGPLPEDFPGHVPLELAGIKTFAQLRKHGWVDVPGIGPATSDKITARLQELGQDVADLTSED